MELLEEADVRHHIGCKPLELSSLLDLASRSWMAWLRRTAKRHYSRT